jgi:hypothetical protein
MLKSSIPVSEGDYSTFPQIWILCAVQIGDFARFQIRMHAPLQKPRSASLRVSRYAYRFQLGIH